MSAGAGQPVELIATDGVPCFDVPAWADDMGHELRRHFKKDGDSHFVTEKS